MPNFEGALSQGISQGFTKFKGEREKEFSGRNPQASNFLKAFLGSGALQFQDESGTVSIDPRTGAFSGTPKNPEGIGFEINPLMQSASLRKGPFEISGGLKDAPINLPFGYGTSNEQFFGAPSAQQNTPWGRIGFKIGGNQSIQNFQSDETESQPTQRQFANPEVEKLLNKVTSPWNSGPDKYNPSTW